MRWLIKVAGVLLVFVALAAAAQESIEARLINGSTFTGTANNQRAVRISFTKNGDELLAQYGSTGQAAARISGNRVSFRFRYNGADVDAVLTLSEDGSLRGTMMGGRTNETLSLKARAP
jgi:hypothetical protein